MLTYRTEAREVSLAAGRCSWTTHSPEPLIPHKHLETSFPDRHLRKFARELEDLGTHYNHNIEFSGGLTLADFFLDGLIVDWFVQNRIHASHEEVRKMRNKTHAVTIDLDSLREKFVAELKRLEEEQRRILEPSYEEEV
jgi:hypothetical protein